MFTSMLATDVGDGFEHNVWRNLLTKCVDDDYIGDGFGVGFLQMRRAFNIRKIMPTSL